LDILHFSLFVSSLKYSNDQAHLALLSAAKKRSGAAPCYT